MQGRGREDAKIPWQGILALRNFVGLHPRSRAPVDRSGLCGHRGDEGQPCFLSCALSMAARPLRRRARGPARAAAGRCRWCTRAGSDAPDSCTWSSVGSELGKFTCAADVRAACPGHMAASVWRGGRCRQENADRLKRWLAASEAECSGSVPQHAWAHHALDAYEWERLHALEQAGSSEGSCTLQAADNFQVHGKLNATAGKGNAVFKALPNSANAVPTKPSLDLHDVEFFMTADTPGFVPG